MDNGIVPRTLNGNLLVKIANSDSIVPSRESNLILRVSDSSYHLLHGWSKPLRGVYQSMVKSYYDRNSPFDTVVNKT